jgi:tetratricopeptide (TPR) repeat protein
MRSNLFDTPWPFPSFALLSDGPTHLYGTIVWTILVLSGLLFYGWKCYAESDDRRVLISKWAASIVLIFLIRAAWHLVQSRPPLFGLFVIPCVLFGLLWTPNVVSIALRPLTGLFEGGGEHVEPKPFYFIAAAKRTKGQYQEAIAEIRKQLEQFPGDFEGSVLLATIQAENLKDLPAAQATINELLEQASLTPQQTATALHTLADWQLQQGRNAAAARATLERIAAMFPDTQFAHAAEQRIAHLGDVVATRDFRENARFAVPQRERNIGLRKDAPVEPETFDPGDMAAQYVGQLEKHPADTDTREKLAVLYAEHFDRIDLAVDQLEQLIALPDETPKHVARWLNLLATLQIGVAQNEAAARTALQRIIDRFPASAAADMATSRLGNLRRELKAGTAAPTKALGTYEKDVGLKRPAA